MAQITFAAPFCNYLTKRSREETDLPWLPEFNNQDVIGVLDGMGSNANAPLIFNYEFTPYHSIYYGAEKLMDISAEQLEDEIRLNGVSYIYVNGLNNETETKYSHLFKGEGEVSAKSYFKVIYENDKMRFEKLLMPL